MNKTNLLAGLILLCPLALGACGGKQADDKEAVTPKTVAVEIDETPASEPAVSNENPVVAKATEAKPAEPKAKAPKKVGVPDASDDEQETWESAVRAMNLNMDSFYIEHLSNKTNGLFDYLGSGVIQVTSQTNNIVYLDYTIELMRGGNESTTRECKLKGEYNIDTGATKFENIPESCLW